MRNLAEYIMRGRKQAILVALLFSILPMFGWVAVVIMGLVTLRKGAKEGAIILAWIILPSLVIALKGFPQLLIYDVIGGSIATYGMAVMLRQTADWGKVLSMAAFVGLGVIIMLHLIFPDINLLWNKELAVYFEYLRQHFKLDLTSQQAQLWAAKMSYIATGVQLSLLLLGDTFNLILARWCQAKLYNPHGLQSELLNIRLGTPAVVVLLLTLLGCLFGNLISIDAICLILAPFFIAGLSLFHSAVAIKKLSKVWIIIFYILLILFFPYLAVITSAFALADSWLNFRQRLVIKNQ